MAREMHRGFIYNDGTGTETKGNYVAEFLKKGHKNRDQGSIWKMSKIYNFPRKRGLAWDLVAQGLILAMGPERMSSVWNWSKKS